VIKPVDEIIYTTRGLAEGFTTLLTED